jgi:ABC-type proline/glycine betaine transport system permease subunit
MRFDWLYRESGRIAELFVWHLGLSVIPVLIGLLLALPLGWIAQRAGLFRSTLLGAAGCSTRFRRWRSLFCCRSFLEPASWIL